MESWRAPLPWPNQWQAVVSAIVPVSPPNRKLGRSGAKARQCCGVVRHDQNLALMQNSGGESDYDGGVAGDLWIRAVFIPVGVAVEECEYE